jgi:uncharacterized protein
MSIHSTRRTFLAGGLGLAAARSVEIKALPRNSTASLTYRTLGKTGLKVTSVGFGCMITSDVSVIKRAADLGINHFDTARVYMGGNNESLVGEALKEHRKGVQIATKVLRRDPREAAEDLDISLRELRTDYVDIWYLHDIRKPEDLAPELIEVQQEAVRAGKVRFTGFSLHMNHREVIPAALATGKFDVMLTTYNFALGTEIDDLILQARKAGLGIVGMKAMAGSFRFPGATDDRFQAKVKGPGVPVAALKWTLRNSHMDCVIPSIKDMEELDEDVQAMSVPYAPADEKILSAQLDAVRPLYCHGCGTCSATCCLGLPVPDLVRFAMYSEGYGEYRLGREQFLSLPPESRDPRCLSCPTCTIQCPNGVNVAERVRRAQELYGRA